jgi:hypothetical protein
MRLVPLFALCLAACGPSAGDFVPLEGGDTCTALASGTWTFTGAAWAMAGGTMDGDVTMDADACTFTLDEWDMAMDDLPLGGAVDGDTVQLDGLDSYWRSCTGTAADENSVAGTCADDGAEWTMVLSDGM